MTSIEFIEKMLKSPVTIARGGIYLDIETLEQIIADYQGLKINYDVAYECLKKQHEEIKQLKEKINEI